MENSTNVKSLTAMFNAAPSPMEGAEKSPGNPPLNSFQARRAEFAKANNLNSGTLPKKPVSPKPPQVPKSASDEIKHPALRPVGINRFGGSVHGPSQDSDVKPTFPKPPGFKTFEQPKDEPKVPFPKPIGNKPLLTTNSPLEHRFGVKPPVPTEEKQKPAFPKPSAIKASSENELKPYVQKKPPFGAKPSSNTVGSPGEVNATKPGLVSKTFSNSLENKPAKQTKETPEENLAPGPTSQSWVPLRPTGVKPLQSPFLKQNPDEPHDRAKQGTPLKDYQAKVNHDGGNSQPPVSKYPRFPSTNQMPPAPDNLREQKDSSEPKRKSLPTPAQLGPPPQKPARPPNVDIERYRSGKTMGSKVTVSEQKSSALSSALPPPPPPVKSLAGSSPIPSLPPRNIRSINEDHKHEDGAVIDDISEESDEECYEGIDDSAQYKREQEEKNEKKRKKKLEQAKREQKEKEKKEQELTKRFRLTEKIEVIHQAQANMDYKGSKNELSFRNGDQIEIIRVTDNPEGKWLGRMKGNYGYIKTAMVKVDYDSLPRKNPKLRAPVNIESDQDIYDDVGEQDSVSNTSLGGNSYFPPPPSNDEDDIYDGVDDGPPDRANSTFGSDVYDDVESCDFPPPPIELGLPVKPSNLGNSLDLKAIKKLEKEEKEFRKKFKFTGDIRILSSVQVVTSLAAKKWGSKDLPLKPGETLDVIQHANDTTLLCKNNEGKYGYVSKSNIIDDDGEIYDDIGENCIYDND
ncbi:FYN-binding protein 1 isoform X4 [Bufo bufo]|uniref:FYN-binding protein 1 isoform X4 n=1 Tax=Bufo bufo TaxID=8384 RepID=UPI001ABE5D74|nr:FYN-binding protein 1 isoform X4 [Bufo bufo]